MRNHSTPLYRQLAAAGVRAPTVTPGADIQSATFNVIGLPPVTGDMRNYAMNFVVRLTTVFDPDAAGSAVNWDKLYKCMSSIRLFSPMLGEPYQTAHTRGAVLGHIYQVLGSGYCYPQPARIQLPASTDADVTLDLYYVLPIGHEFLQKPHETAQFIGLYEQGELEARVAASSALDGDYAGAVLKATTTLRAWIEYIPSPDNFIGVPFQFREYIIPGNSTEFVLRGMGGASGLKGVANDGCGLGALGWLTDATGIGLSGADGADEINRIDIPWRSQSSIDIVDPFFSSLRRMVQHRVGPISGLGTTIMHDGGGWPYTMAATPDNSLANAQALFVPLVMPGKNFETSKAQHVKGDNPINLGFGTTPSGSSRFFTLEYLEYDVPQLEAMTRALGLDPQQVVPSKKAYNQTANEKQLRYTRVMLG
jgi:hypothetical protein